MSLSFLPRSARVCAPAALLAAALLAGCGGGSSVPPPLLPNQPAAGPGSGSAAFVVTVPAASKSGAQRAYISGATQSLGIAVDGGIATTFDVTPSSKGCVGTGGGTTCTESLSVPAGAHVFTLTTYAKPGAQGAALSTNSTGSVTIVAGKTTSIPVTLDGIVSSVTLALANPSPAFGTSTPVALTVVLRDGAGVEILGADPFAHPITLTTSDAKNGALSKTTLASPADANGITTTYTGATPGGITYGATASGLAAQNVTPAVLHPAIAYTAIGASDAVGYGASVPCANPPTVANPTCPGGTGYVPDLRNELQQNGAVVTLDDLGISGGVLGPDILKLANMYGQAGNADACRPRNSSDAYPADFITSELPNVPASSSLVTIFAGGNDTNGIVNALGCGAGGTTVQTQTAFITQQITNFGNDLFSLVTQVHSKAPAARIYIANLPNFALIPFSQSLSPAARQALAAVSVGIDQNVINKAAGFGVPVVDLLCDPRSYDPANFFTDGFHPDDAGYLALSQAFLAQIDATTPVPPAATCSFATRQAVLREAVARPIPRFER